MSSMVAPGCVLVRATLGMRAGASVGGARGPVVGRGEDEKNVAASQGLAASCYLGQPGDAGRSIPRAQPGRIAYPARSTRDFRRPSRPGHRGFRNPIALRGPLMKILMVLTSHDRLGDTGKKTGFWLEELAAPYYVFEDAGADITLASPLGGQPPLDPKSDEPDAQTDATRRFRADKTAMQALASTRMPASMRADDFDAVFYPGGHGPLWDL